MQRIATPVAVISGNRVILLSSFFSSYDFKGGCSSFQYVEVFGV
jgi:hypothetical protein